MDVDRFPRGLQQTAVMDPFLATAIDEAKKGLSEGGIPIGSVLVHEGKIIGRGHNQRVQRGSVIHHGEMNCLENAGRQSAAVYRECTLYTTLSPCPMCTGAILLYGIPRVVIGENVTFLGAEDSLRAAGVEVDVLQDAECIRMMREFIEKNPELWNEDIGR
jgi:cytosine/creatinine deaminase